ncbi:tyrosine-type recombinase/integrase [Nostoc sp. C057]|uniref:tyrosine-type recombinase/integrase n=1 Tax=Nostoc sp. C057 TaxID=2576903 RepID=UPI00277B500F|nr:tyrosine-type recombinase/integrase [Nostoc sp. C057]
MESLNPTFRRLLNKVDNISHIYTDKAHCHMMRHACGYYLMNQGYNTREIQDFLGHRFPQTH